MAGHGTGQPVDVLRKLAIVTALLALLVGMYHFAPPTTDPVKTVLLAVGFVVLASYTVGELAEAIKLPYITGYLLTGLLLGASAAHTLVDYVPGVAGYLVPPFNDGLLSEQLVGRGGQLNLLDTLALALICLTAGGELRIDVLRHGIRRVLGILGILAAVIIPGTMLVTLAISGRVPLLPAFGPFTELNLSALLAIGAVLGTVSLATAPAPTIAVINSTGSKGPMTRDVLPSVVLLDVVVVVAFSAASAVAVGLVPGAAAGTTVTSAMVVIVGSIALGAVVGGLAHLYLRYIHAELLLFIVFLVFATSQAATGLTHWWDPSAHAELAMVFIAAGFVVANFSPMGDALIHQVERLSVPVYVLFFTMAGAKLHVDDLINSGLFALFLVGSRVLLMYVGVRLGATVMGAHSSTQRHGWMGFVSQAGLALALADSIQSTYSGELGTGLFSLVLAGVAMNEMMGPVLLQLGLTRAGETAAQRAEGDADDAVTEAPAAEASSALEPWQRDEPESDAWGDPCATGQPAIDQAVNDLELELRGLIRDLESGPLPALQREAHTYVRGLRRDMLLLHRHLETADRSDTDAFLSFLRAELAALSDRWRDALLDRGAVLKRPGWSPLALQTAVDQRVDNLPEAIAAPIPAAVLVARDEPLGPRLARGWLRLRARVGDVERMVRVRELGRYHLRADGAARMEGLAALLVNAELHLASRTAALFEAVDRAADRLANVAREEPPRLDEAITALRAELETDFRLALDEVSWMATDARARATSILGGGLRRLKADLLRYDTPDLPARRRPYARMFDRRTEGLTALSQGLEQARHTAANQYAATALAFEVLRLEIRVKEAVEAHGERLCRQIRGKGLKHLCRVEEALDQLATAFAEALDQPGTTGAVLAPRLEELSKPALHIADEAIESAKALRDWLAGDASDQPLLDAIVQASHGLTERYDVPTEPPRTGEWALPQPVETTEVPFREVTVSFLEANVTRDVVDVTRRLAVQIDGVLHALQDARRTIQFNIDLGRSELEVHGESVPDETRELIREMVFGPWRRCRERLQQAHDQAEPWGATASREVREAVLGKLDTYRAQVVSGRVGDLLQYVLREVRARGQYLSADGARALMTRTVARVTQSMTRTLGDERIATVRHQLGLVDEIEVALPQSFARPRALERLPPVYQRLFSDHALEAGDLLTGRDAEYADAFSALGPERAGLYRAVALISLDGIVRRALANALVRGLGISRTRRITPTRAVTVAEVSAWFEDEPGGLVVLDGLMHLYECRPGGYAPLRRFLRGVLEDAGRTTYILLAEPAVWDHARVTTHIDEVFSRALRLRRLALDELTSALLARHNMSGYQLRVQPGHDLAWQLADLLVRGDDPDERYQRAWFRTLHQASDGVMQDALRLWMASILDISDRDNQIVLGDVPRPPLARLRRLPDPSLLALRSALIHGRLSPTLYATAYRCTATEAHTLLGALRHAGLLQLTDSGHRIPDHLKTSVDAVLRSRGWL